MTWNRFKTHCYQYPSLGVSLDISRIPFPDDFLAAIEPRMIGAQNVRQALDYVARGEVDAGFVYSTDAALMPDKVKVALTVPTKEPILYPVAPVAASTNQAMAVRFVDFLGSPQARAVLTKYGFGNP